MASQPQFRDKIGIAESKSLQITVWESGISIQRREKVGDEWVTKGDVSIPRATLERFVSRVLSDYLPAIAKHNREHPSTYKKN